MRGRSPIGHPMLRSNGAPGKETVVPISCSILPAGIHVPSLPVPSLLQGRDASDATTGTEKLDFQGTTQET